MAGSAPWSQPGEWIPRCLLPVFLVIHIWLVRPLESASSHGLFVASIRPEAHSFLRRRLKVGVRASVGKFFFWERNQVWIMHQIHCKEAFIKHPKASKSFREGGIAHLTHFLLCYVTVTVNSCVDTVSHWSNSSAQRQYVFTCSFKQFSTWLGYFECKKNADSDNMSLWFWMSSELRRIFPRHRAYAFCWRIVILNTLLLTTTKW